MADLDLIRQRARDAVKLLAGAAKVRAAYLFGSQVTGQTHEFSDVDIGVFIEGLETMDLDRRVDLEILVQEHLGNDLELHFFPAEALVHADPAGFAAYILRQGVSIFDRS